MTDKNLFDRKRSPIQKTPRPKQKTPPRIKRPKQKTPPKQSRSIRQTFPGYKAGGKV